MGSSQSTESPATTATRQSPDQRIVGNSGGSAVGDLSSRKTGAMPSSSRQNHTDSSRMLFMSVGDSRRGELSSRGGGGGVKMSSRREGRDSDDSPSSHHHTLTQPPPPQQRSTAPPTTQSQHHSPHLIHPSHSHHPQNRSHPHRQRNRHPLPPPDNLPPTLDYELGVPSLMFSRSQPTVAGNPTNREPELELVIPRASSRSRRYYDGGSAGDVELDLSMASLSRRLRAVGLFTEENGGGSSSSSGGLSGSGGGLSSSSSSRRHHRPRRHHSHSSHGSSSGGSRSRRYLANSATPSSVVLVRGLSASKFMYISLSPFLCVCLSLSLPFFVSVCLSLSRNISVYFLLYPSLTSSLSLCLSLHSFLVLPLFTSCMQ